LKHNKKYEEIELNFDASCQQILGLESKILWEARSTPNFKAYLDLPSVERYSRDVIDDTIFAVDNFNHFRQIPLPLSIITDNIEDTSTLDFKFKINQSVALYSDVFCRIGLQRSE
jgi:hypothetical protein